VVRADSDTVIVMSDQLKRLQIFDQIVGLLVTQTEPKEALQCRTTSIERCETPVVVELTFCVRPNSLHLYGSACKARD
jgi:hypothetical protein